MRSLATPENTRMFCEALFDWVSESQNQSNNNGQSEEGLSL